MSNPLWRRKLKRTYSQPLKYETLPALYTFISFGAEIEKYNN